MSGDENMGPLGKVASWVEYPFTSDSFPWTTGLLIAAIVVVVVFFMHDGLRVIAETVGERV